MSVVNDLQGDIENLTAELERVKAEQNCPDGLACNACAKCFDRERAAHAETKAQVEKLRDVLEDIVAIGVAEPEFATELGRYFRRAKKALAETAPKDGEG